MFGRQEVLTTLSRHLHDVQQQRSGRMIAVRGRRQVGKSTVIERFVQSSGTPYVFVTAVHQAPARRQLEDATLALTESLNPLPDATLLAQSPAGSWREWLGRLAIAARSGPVVAVLDEFPWLTAADPALEGELQVAWDRTLEQLPVLLILIGSDVTMMERLASHDRPLFGRLQPLVIPPLNPWEVSQALAGWSAFQIFDAYLVTGGYPRLLRDLAHSGHASAESYVRASLSDVYSPLITTARLSLDAEFPDGQAAYQVLSAIGSDDTANPSYSDILSVIGDPAERHRTQTAITRAFRTLTDAKDLVERETPAWAPANSKQRRYRVKDPYLRFWFRYVERQVERIARGRADLALAYFDRDWSSWRGRSVEPVVRKALERLAPYDPHLADVETVRPWWVRDGSAEVDVVAASAKTSVLLGTIKWRPRRGATAEDITELRLRQTRIPRSDNALLAAINPDGVAPRGADVAYGADDLLAAWTGDRTRSA